MTTQTLNTENTTSLKSAPNLRNLLSLFVFAASIGIALIGTGCSEKSPMSPVVEPAAQVKSVEIENAPVYMLPGTFAFLNAKVEADAAVEDRTVVWTSSAPGLLRVNARGKLSALAPGTVEVTARAAADDQIRDRVRVVVTRPEATPRIEAITLSASQEEMTAGTTQTLDWTVEAFGTIDTSVRWTTSDAAVATVANGIVTARDLGSVRIDAISNADPSKSASVNLTVNPAIPPMEGHPVKGWDANFVDYASADGRIVGRFSQGHGINWLEENDEGTFHFVETARDEWSISLNDTERGVQVQLNLWTKKVKLPYGEYIVTAAGTTAVEPMDGHAVNGWNATWVQYDSADRKIFGSFRKSGANWIEENNEGTNQFVETHRDEWSVHLNDARRNVQIQLDLWSKKVLISPYNSQYVVTDAR